MRWLAAVSVLTFPKTVGIVRRGSAHAPVVWGETLLGTTWRFLLLFRWSRQRLVGLSFNHFGGEQ